MVKTGLKIDRFGACFENSNPFPRTGEFWKMEEFKRYKFYLAFENSHHCTDYFTEKLWQNSLEAGLVPIVWGPSKGDLLAALPPDSFVFVEDFATIEDLSAHIKHLDENDEEYKKYFRWRESSNPTVESMEREVLEKYPNLVMRRNNVSMCDFYHMNRYKKNTVSSVSDVFIKNEPKECTNIPLNYNIKNFFKDIWINVLSFID